MWWKFSPRRRRAAASKKSLWPKKPLVLEYLEQRLAPSATVSTDQANYVPGQTAQISGSGYAAKTTVQVKVIRPDSSSTSTSVTTDSKGRLSSTYKVGDLFGTYTVDVLSGSTLLDVAHVGF